MVMPYTRGDAAGLNEKACRKHNHFRHLSGGRLHSLAQYHSKGDAIHWILTMIRQFFADKTEQMMGSVMQGGLGAHLLSKISRFILTRMKWYSKHTMKKC